MRLLIIKAFGTLSGAVAAAAVAAPGAAAQGQSLTEQIEAQQAVLARPDATPGERLEAIEKKLALRKLLIDSHPDDDQLAVWLADQASDMYFELLPLDAAGLTALFGSPTPQQLERAQRAARGMHDAAKRAEAAIGGAILKIESAADYQKNPALQERRRELAETQRDRRIPFLRGVGAFLHGQFNVADDLERRPLFEFAARVLPPLADALEGPVALDARLYGGLAQARLGHFDAGEAPFAAVARDAGASASQMFAARMGGVLNRTVRGGAAAGLDALASVEQRYAVNAAEPSSLFYRVLIADQRFLLRRSLAREAPAGQRDEVLAQAFTAYTDLLKIETSVGRETVRAIVFARLSNAADAELPLDRLPGIVTVARADQLSRSEATREDAITMLEGALGAGRLDADAAPAGLFVLARSLYEHGQGLFAAQRFIELAERYPADSQAQRAMEAGVTIAGELHRRAPSDPEARGVLRHGLEVLLKRYVNLPTIDRWRYAAGRLAMDEERFDEAAATFGQITPDAAQWDDAHFMQAALCQARAGKAADESQKRHWHEQTLATIEQVKPIIEAGIATADAARAAALRDYLAMLRVYRAQAQLGLSQPQIALQTLSDIERDPGIGVSVVGEALKVRIAAHQALKQPEQALAEMDRFVQSSPQQAGDVLLPMLASMQRDVEALIEISRDDEATELARRTLLPAAQLLEVWLKSYSGGGRGFDLDLARRRLADAYRLAGRFEESLARYEQILNEHPDDAELLLGRAESLFNLGGEERLGEAMGIYKRLSAAGAAAGTERYWLSQLRMLQIVDRVNRNIEQIAPRIERLRQHDPALGGERFRRAFDALRMKYGG